MWKYSWFICIYFYCFIPFATLQKRFKVESLYINTLSFFRVSHFSSKKSLSLFPGNTLKNISTLEFFTCESIKASNFPYMICFNRELNLFYFSNIRYQNNKTYFRLLLLLSEDFSLNTGPINGSQQHNYYQWTVF